MNDRVYLCNDCGKIMYCFTNKCLSCTQTNISLHIGNDCVKQALKKSNQLNKGKNAANKVEAFLYFSVVLMIIFAVAFFILNKERLVKTGKAIKQSQIKHSK